MQVDYLLTFWSNRQWWQIPRWAAI